jgi:hypothetical protein
MRWFAAELQEEIGWTRTVCENVSGLLVEIDLRALDEDAHVPVLVNPHAVKDLITSQVLRHVVGLCFRRSFLRQNFLEANLRAPLRLVGKNCLGKLARIS